MPLFFQLVLKDERINPDELRDYSETDTVTKVEGGEIALSKEFVRDIRKLWVKTDGRKVYLCIENQTELDVKDQVRMTLYTLVHILSIMEKTGEVLPIVPLIIVWGKKGENEELNIHDLFPKDTPDEIMKYQMYIRIPVIYVLGIKEEDAVKGRSIFDVLEDLKVEIAADAKAKNWSIMSSSYLRPKTIPMKNLSIS